jgi:glycerol-3-phosphate dehydrogenase
VTAKADGMKTSLSPQNRFDVVVIGGGINGTSAVRELSAAGYKVLLAEQADFANGASGRSSRILHCGLRYFETPRPVRTFASSPRSFVGALRMAKDAMGAREELVRLQPQRCKPFTMCFPLYGKDDIRGWHLDLGFALLKWLGPPDLPLDYRRLQAREFQTLAFAADLRDQDQLRSIATYREYVIDWPDRICVDAALAAEQDGAEIRLFTRAELRQRTPDGDWVVDLIDKKAGIRTVTAAAVLNLAGTWIDDVGRSQTPVGAQPLIRGTKGAHIVIRLPDRYRGFGVAALNRSGMPIYCLPFRDDRFYFGPTETPFDGDASNVHANDNDIDFLLSEANHLLPALKLTREDVEFSWAGVRPLSFDPDLPMGRRTREIHDLAGRGQPKVLAMTAGPVMTHRSAGRELRDAVARMTEPARGPAHVNTRQVQQAYSAMEPSIAAFRKAVTAEHARDLRGILYTRTGLAWGRHLDPSAVKEVADGVADLLGWSPEEVGEQVAGFLEYQQTVFRAGVPIQSPNKLVVTA